MKCLEHFIQGINDKSRNDMRRLKEKILLGLVWTCCLASCTNKDVNDNDVFFSKSQKNVKTSDIMKDCSLIKLETQDKNLILDVSMMKIWKDRIYILDCFAQNKTIWVYDINGKYVGRVGALGQGPGEYIMPMSLVVDETNNQILVKDVAQNKLLYYDAQTLSCVKEMSIPFYSDCLEYLGPDRLIWYVGSGCANQGDFQKHIQITDMNLNVVDNFMPRMDFPKRGLYNVMSYFHRYKGNAYFHHPFSEYVYAYENQSDSIVNEYVLSFENLQIPSMDYLRNNQKDIIKQLKVDGYIQYYDLLENDKKILCYFGRNDKAHIGVYSKERKIGYYTEVENLDDDLGILKFIRPKTVYNDHFVSVVYTEDLEAITEKSIIYPLVKDETDGGNPIVLLYK